MPGIFGLFDYTKEGPGVYANEPPKGPFRLFFEILFRKFWKIITINLMYLAFSLPALALGLLLAPLLLQYLLPGLNEASLKQLILDSAGSLTTEELAQAVSFYQIIGYAFVSLFIVGMGYVAVGPVLAGTTYLLRNYAREEHAFVWMDFKESVRTNWKQSLVVCLLSLVLLVVLVFDYGFFGAQESAILQGLLTGLIIVLGIVLTIMLMYVYPLLVTFQLPLKKVLRNALLLTLARFLPNLGILLLNAFLLVGIPFLVLLLYPQGSAIISLVWFGFLAFGLTQFLTNFYVYRQFKKYMIKPEPEPAQAPPSVEGPAGS